MGRRKVVEISCDRCSKVETQNEAELAPDGQPEARVEWGGKATVYQDLCRRCRETVKNYVRRILLASEDKKEDEGVTPNPSGVKKGPTPLAIRK